MCNENSFRGNLKMMEASAGGGQVWGVAVPRGWSPTAVGLEKPDTESDEALGELSDAGSCSTAAPERLGTDKSSGCLRGRGAGEGEEGFPFSIHPSGAGINFLTSECAQLASGSQNLLSDLHQRTENVNVALDTVIRVLLQQQRRRSMQSFFRFGKNEDTISQYEGEGRSQYRHLRSNSNRDCQESGWDAVLDSSVCVSPASAGPSARLAAQKCASTASGRASLAGERRPLSPGRALGVAASTSAEEWEGEGSGCCWYCRRPFISVQQQQVEHELERLQQTRLRERARADLQAVKRQADIQKLQQQTQELEGKIKEKEEALRSAQAHIRALQQQLTEQRQLARCFNEQQPAKVEILNTLVFSPSSKSLRLPSDSAAAERPQQGDHTKRSYSRDGKQQHVKDGKDAQSDDREEISGGSAVVGLRDLTQVSRRLAQHVLPADSTSPGALLQLQRYQQQKDPKKSTEATTQATVVTEEPTGELPCCLPAVSLCIKSTRAGSVATEQTPADLLAQDFKLRMQALRKAAAPESRIPAVKEWMEMFTCAWRLLQARMKSVTVPERPTEKSLRLVKEKLETEKTQIFRSLTQLQQESLRIMKQVLQTPWQVSELEKEKESQAVYLTELRKEVRRLFEKSTELDTSLRECKQALAAAERERDRLAAVSELCAVDVNTRFEQLQEKRHLLQETQAAHAHAEAAVVASEQILSLQQEQLRGHQQQLIRKQQLLTQKQEQLDQLSQQYGATKQSEKVAHQELHIKREESESLRMEIESLLTEREKLGEALLETQHQLAVTTGALQAQEKKQMEKHQELLNHFARLHQQLQPSKRASLPAALRVGRRPVWQQMQHLRARKYVLCRFRRRRKEKMRRAKKILWAASSGVYEGTIARTRVRPAAPISSTAAVGDREAVVPGTLGESSEEQQQKLLWLRQLGAVNELEKSWVSVIQSLPRVEKQLHNLYATAAATSRPATEENDLSEAEMEEIEHIVSYTCHRAAYLREILQRVNLPKGPAVAESLPLQTLQQDEQDQSVEEQLSGIQKTARSKEQSLIWHLKQENVAGADWSSSTEHAEDGVSHRAYSSARAPVAAKTRRREVGAKSCRPSMIDKQFTRVRRNKLSHSRKLYSDGSLPASANLSMKSLGRVAGRLHVAERGRAFHGIHGKRRERLRHLEELSEAKGRRKWKSRARVAAENKATSSNYSAHSDAEESALYLSLNRVYVHKEAQYGASPPVFRERSTSDKYQKGSSRSRKRKSHTRSIEVGSTSSDIAMFSVNDKRMHGCDEMNLRDREKQPRQLFKQSYTEAGMSILSQQRRRVPSSGMGGRNPRISVQVRSCSSLCLSSSNTGSTANTTQNIPGTSGTKQRSSPPGASPTNSDTERLSTFNSNRSGGRGVARLERAEVRRFSSETPCGDDRSLLGKFERRRKKSCCSEVHNRVNKRSDLDSSEEGRSGVLLFGGAAAISADASSHIKRITAPQEGRLPDGCLRKRSFIRNHRYSSRQRQQVYK